MKNLLSTIITACLLLLPRSGAAGQWASVTVNTNTMQMNPPVVGVMVTNQWNASPQDNRPPANFQCQGISLTNNVPFQFVGITNNGGTAFSMRLSTMGQCTNSPVITVVADKTTNTFPLWDFLFMRGGCYDNGLQCASAEITASAFDGATNLVCSGQHGRIYLNWRTNLTMTVTASSIGGISFYSSILALLGPPVTADTWHVEEYVNTNLAGNAVASNNIVTGAAARLESFYEFLLDTGCCYPYPDDSPVLMADGNTVQFGMGGEDSVGGSWGFGTALPNANAAGVQANGGTQIYWEPNWGNFCFPFMENVYGYTSGCGNNAYRFFDFNSYLYPFTCTNSLAFVKTNASGNPGQTDVYLFTYRTIP